MIPQKKGRLPGLVGKAKISSGDTMHIPQRVMGYFSLQQGDILEFYNPLVDLPEDLTLKFELIAVVVKRQKPVEPKQQHEETRGGAPPGPLGVPADNKPHKVFYDSKGNVTHVETVQRGG